MITALTRGIGAELYKPLRIQYWNWKKTFINNISYRQSNEMVKLFLHDVLALSLFNQYVMTPIYGASNFTEESSQMGVTRVRMGSHHIDKKFTETTEGITKQFYAINKNYGLKVEQLHIASANEFIEHWIGVVKNNVK